MAFYFKYFVTKGPIGPITSSNTLLYLGEEICGSQIQSLFTGHPQIYQVYNAVTQVKYSLYH